MLLRVAVSIMLFASACGVSRGAGWGRRLIVSAAALLLLIQPIDALVTFWYVIPEMGGKKWFIFGLTLPSFDAGDLSTFSLCAYCLNGGYALITIMIFNRPSVKSALP